MSIASHDLRTPLTVATGHLELAAEQYDSEDLDEVRAAMERMEWMIEDLLTLSTVDELVADLEAWDLPALVEDGWRTVDAPAATLSVETERTVLGDGNRLRQLLENLLGNAVEHAGP